MKKIVTIFSGLFDLHLSKDVGQVVNYLAMGGVFSSKIVTYKNQSNYKELGIEAKNVEIEFLPIKYKLWNLNLGVLFYLFKKSREIDVLNLYGRRTLNLIYAFIYKSLNRKGYVYIKMDCDIFYYLNQIGYSYKFKELIFNIFCNLVDLYSIETIKSYEYFLQQKNKINSRLIYLPNCVNDLYINKNIRIKNYSEKENIILVVGRIGAKQKNHQLLLEAIKKIELGEWKIVFIGPIEDSFKNTVQKLKLNNSKVIFQGNIQDRTDLYEWYNRSKIFCLTSDYEGFSVASVEALYFGNWIVASRLTSTEEILNDQNNGFLFEPGNQAELEYLLKKSIEKGFLCEEKFLSIRKFAMNRYEWSKNIKKLESILLNS